MFAQENVMEIQRQAFQEWYIANHHDGDIHPNQQLLEWSEKGGFYFASSVEDLWEAWQAAKAQAVPEGFVLVSAEQMSQWGHMASYAEQYGCPECFEARGYAHSLACEINEFFAIEAQEQAND